MTDPTVQEITDLCWWVVKSLEDAPPLKQPWHDVEVRIMNVVDWLQEKVRANTATKPADP